jgi:putative membrane protein
MAMTQDLGHKMKSIKKMYSSKPLDMDLTTRSDVGLDKYAEYPLVLSLLRYEPIRSCSFKHDGFDQFEYPGGNGGWIETLCIIRGRAFHQIWLPFTVVTINAVAVTLLFELGHFDQETVEAAVGEWQVFYSFVLNVVLSFLLVFRLNRAATRYWLSRQFWGQLIARGRLLTSGILSHGAHNPSVRDEAIRWVGAVAVSTMVFMRGEKKIPEHTLDGVLNRESVSQMESALHMPIYASDMLRDALKRLFYVTADTPPGLAHAWTVQLDRLEGELAELMNQFGGMERVRSTPLPIVYVSHLRTFLLIHLLLFPYVFGPNQGWATIPLLMITAFAFLGIEGASSEVENPFKKGHVNNLNMDALAMGLIQNMQQQVQTKADLELSRSRRIETA